MLSDTTIQAAIEALEYARQNHEAFWSTWAIHNERLSEQRATIAAALAELQALASQQQGNANTDGLLPCPFCGSEAQLIEIDGYRPSSPKTYRIMCSADDGVVSLELDTEAEAVAWWNRRYTHIFVRAVSGEKNDSL